VTYHTRGAGSDPASIDLQQLWFGMLRRRTWASLVVVPADTTTPATSIARGLAKVGERYLGRRVAFIIPAEFSSVEQLLTPGVSPRSIAGRLTAAAEPVTAEAEEQLERPVAVESRIARIVSRNWNPLSAHYPDLGDLPEASSAPGRVIVALEPVVSNPFGIAVALAADAALLCITLGETTLDSAKRTVELIGPERFIGCAAVRPS
jgi:hypothetical protein